MTYLMVTKMLGQIEQGRQSQLLFKGIKMPWAHRLTEPERTTREPA